MTEKSADFDFEMLGRSVEADMMLKYGSKLIRTCPGTYGLVFILQNPANTTPAQFAVKTFTGKNTVGISPEAAFAREVRVGLSLPPHLNVVPTLDVIRFRLLKPNGTPTGQTLPGMVMARAHCALDDWITGREKRSFEEKLWVLLGAINGLAWLHTNGVEGHGDLKPANILIRDIADDFTLPEDRRTGCERWNARIADLGWADIWRDLHGPEWARTNQRAS